MSGEILSSDVTRIDMMPDCHGPVQMGLLYVLLVETNNFLNDFVRFSEFEHPSDILFSNNTDKITLLS